MGTRACARAGGPGGGTSAGRGGGGRRGLERLEREILALREQTIASADAIVAANEVGVECRVVDLREWDTYREHRPPEPRIVIGDVWTPASRDCRG
jgi:hypothetical protein